MDLDLSTNGSSIKENINFLQSGKISWIVLGYVGNKTISIIETGDDSLEDMFEEFHGSKIMYGFASVTDPNSKLKKNLFIYWQGSGATQVMKTKSVQHSNVIRELCKPVHVTITARDEQDLDLKEIMLKVAAASGSNYSCHNEKKEIFETQPAIKSESNTANMGRYERQKELASLGNIKKTPPTITTKSDTNSYKPGPIKNVKPPLNNNITKPSSGYTKINPEKELQSFNTNQKTTFESAERVKSENNTAERAREDRQKELSQLGNRTFNDEPFQQVGTNYSKINPLVEIQKLRKQSQSFDTYNLAESQNPNFNKCDAKTEIARLRRESASNESEANFKPMSNTSTYKKIDPLSEIQALRKSIQLPDSGENISPGSTYKKINPAEEIKNLKSQNNSNFADTPSVPSSYKKVNPMEEIIAARKNSEPPRVVENKIPTQRVSTVNESQSARMTFENIHKKDESHKHTNYEQKPTTQIISPNVKTPIKDLNEEKTENKFNFRKSISNDKVYSPTQFVKSPVKKTEVKQDNKFNFEKEIKKEKMHPIEVVSLSPKHEEKQTKSTAVAIYEYLANDADEISFDVDDLITGVEKIDDGWWIGYNSEGVKGMFPSNYVKLCENNDEPAMMIHDDETNNDVPTDDTTADIDPITSDDVSLTVVAQYTYTAQDQDELSFEEGDTIYHVNKIDDGWWEGVLQSGTRGMFPSNYVSII